MACQQPPRTSDGIPNYLAQLPGRFECIRRPPRCFQRVGSVRNNQLADDLGTNRIRSQNPELNPLNTRQLSIFTFQQSKYVACEPQSRKVSTPKILQTRFVVLGS